MKSWTQWSPRELRKIEALRRRGLTNAEIARKLARPAGAVAALLRDAERRTKLKK